MTARVLPAGDTYAVCPNEGSVLSFYEGTFESVYVLLHPFIRPVAAPAASARENDVLTPQNPSAAGEPVSWREMQYLCSFDSLAEVDIALRTQIGGLKEEFASASLATQLLACAERAGIVAPKEGAFSDLSHHKILSFIQAQGHDWAWVGDEFCTERKLHWIEDLKSPNSTATRGNCNVFTPDRTILWTTHWDSHFSFFCGSKEMIGRLADDAHFEGFECDAATEVYWSVR